MTLKHDRQIWGFLGKGPNRSASGRLETRNVTPIAAPTVTQPTTDCTADRNAETRALAATARQPCCSAALRSAPARRAAHSGTAEQRKEEIVLHPTPGAHLRRARNDALNQQNTSEGTQTPTSVSRCMFTLPPGVECLGVAYPEY